MDCKSESASHYAGCPCNEEHWRSQLAAAESRAERLAAGLQTIADRACHEIRERGSHILWCPDHMPGGRAFWCDSCEARAALAEHRDAMAAAPEGEKEGERGE